MTVVCKLAPNANGKINVVRQGCVWPSQSTRTFYLILTHKHTHTVSWGRKVMQRGERNRLCAVIKKTSRDWTTRASSSQLKNKFANLTQQKKRESKSEMKGFLKWIAKKTSVTEGEVVVGIYKSLNRCYRPSPFLLLTQSRSNSSLSRETRTNDPVAWRNSHYEVC